MTSFVRRWAGYFNRAQGEQELRKDIEEGIEELTDDLLEDIDVGSVPDDSVNRNLIRKGYTQDQIDEFIPVKQSPEPG